MRADRGWTPPHSKIALNESATAAQTGGEYERDKLRRMMRPYVIGMTKRLDGLGGDGYSREMSDELKQAIWEGVWIALDKFCAQPHTKKSRCPGLGEPHPQKGAVTKFSSYAYFWMRHEAQEWMAKNSRALPVSRVAWAQSIELEAAFREAYGEHADIEAASDQTLAALVISDPKGGGDRTVAHAGDIMRAKRNSYAFDADFDSIGRSGTTEDEFFEEVHNMEADALDTMATLEGLMGEGRQDDALEVVSQFIDRHGLPWEVATNMLAEVAA